MYLLQSIIGTILLTGVCMLFLLVAWYIAVPVLMGVLIFLLVSRFFLTNKVSIRLNPEIHVQRKKTQEKIIDVDYTEVKE